MIKFIHTSDWHLGNTFVDFDRDTTHKLNRARFDAVKAIFVYARMKKIPLILCAGDAIDNGQLAHEKHLLELFALVKQFTETRLIMIAGNHDPLMANTVYRRVARESYPPNFTLAGARETIRIDDLPETGSRPDVSKKTGLTIFAASITEKKGDYNPLSWIDPNDIDENSINIGLAHGSIKNEKYKGNPFPIEPDFAREMKLDYLALGDWHSYNKINERTYYPGTPEPLQFGDDGWALEVTIERAKAVPRVEQIRQISQYEWRREEIEITDDKFPAFKARLEQFQPGEKIIRKLTTRGFLSTQNYKIYKELIEMERARYYKIDDQAAIAPQAQDFIDSGDSYLAALAARLLEMKQTPNPIPEEIFDNVLAPGLLSIEQSLKPQNNEIIDKALLKLYTYCRTAGGET